VKECISDLVHVVPNTNENSIWVKIGKDCSRDKVLFIGSFYVSPESRTNKLNLFEILNDDIKILRGKGDIVLQGDFNARTGQKNDFIQPDPFFETLFDRCPETPMLPPRNSEDQGINTRGDQLLDFCKTNELAIVNGRKIGDLFGKLTSHQYNGSSAIDYLITEITNFNKISLFEVGDYTPWLSDHTPIFSQIKLNIRTNHLDQSITLHARDKGYTWDDECEEQFKAFLSNHETILENTSQATKQNSDANKLANEIKNSILNASKECNLKKKKQKKGKISTPWFDKECLDLKKSLTEIGKKLRDDKGNVELRNEIFALKKKLKKMVRKKKRLHKKNFLNEMEKCSFTDQKKYWNLVRQLEQKEDDKTQYVSPKHLSEHYKNLLTAKRDINMPPNCTNIGKLDHPITPEELDKAKHVLKRGKANGIDTINNEMIACVLEVCPHIILTLFNTVLEKNITIDSWTVGIITAIYKNKGSRSETENYRGISLLSCLGKFFTAILYNRLLKFAIDNKILSPAKLGFMPGNRTSDAHLIIHNLVRKQCHNNGGRIYSCFIDFSKAFDTIPRDTLLNKLLKLGID
jgi:hypothetical protein